MAPLLSNWTLGRATVAILVDADHTVAYFLPIVITSLEFVHGVHFAQVCVVFGLLTRPHFPILSALIRSLNILVHESRRCCLINVLLNILVPFLLLHLVK